MINRVGNYVVELRIELAVPVSTVRHVTGYATVPDLVYLILTEEH